MASSFLRRQSIKQQVKVKTLFNSYVKEVFMLESNLIKVLLFSLELAMKMLLQVLMVLLLERKHFMKKAVDSPNGVLLLRLGLVFHPNLQSKKLLTLLLATLPFAKITASFQLLSLKFFKMVITQSSCVLKFQKKFSQQ